MPQQAGSPVFFYHESHECTPIRTATRRHPVKMRLRCNEIRIGKMLSFFLIV
jgi:hypothetical protein